MSDKQMLEFVIRFKNEADAAIRQMQSQMGGLASATDKVAGEQRRANKEAANLRGGYSTLSDATDRLADEAARAGRETGQLAFQFDRLDGQTAAFAAQTYQAATASDKLGDELEAIARTSARVGNEYADMAGDIDRATRETLELAQATDHLGDEQRRAAKEGRELQGVMRGLTAQVAGAFAAFGIGLGVREAIDTLRTYGQELSTVGAVMSATAEQQRQLDETAKRLGANTRFSATQAAEGMTFLARAGFDANETLASIEGTLNLAQAGALDLGRAADIASNVLSGFNIGADQTGRVVDILAKAANSANTDVNQLGEALKFAAPTSVALGLSIEETVATIGKLSDAGIQAGLAGRGFQSFVTRFTADAKKIESLIGTFDLAEEGISNVVKRLVDAGITTQQVVEIFRAENLDIFTVLANASTSGALDDLTEKLRNAAGTAKTMADAMDDNLNGAMFAAASAAESVVLALGDLGVTEALTGFFNGLADALRATSGAFAEFNDYIRDTDGELNLLGQALKVVADVSLVAAGMATLGLAVSAIGTIFGSVGITAKVAWAAVTGPIGTVLLAVTAVGGALTILYNNFQPFADFVDGLTRSIRELWQELTNSVPSQFEAQQKEITDAVKKHDEATQLLTKAKLSDLGVTRQRIALAREELQAARDSAKADYEKAQARIAELEANKAALLEQGRLGYDGVKNTQVAINFTRQHSKELRNLRDSAEELRKKLEEADNAFATEEARQRARDYAKVLWDMVMAPVMAGKAQREETERLNGLQAVYLVELQKAHKAAQDSLATAGLQGEALDRAKLYQEAVNEATEKGFTLSKSHYAVLNDILATRSRERDVVRDIATLDIYGKAKRDLEELTASVARLQSAGSITDNQAAAILGNSSANKDRADFLKEIGIGADGERQAALAEARKTYTELNAQLDQFLKDGTDNTLNEKTERAAIEARFRQDQLDAERAFQTAQSALLQGLGPEAEMQAALNTAERTRQLKMEALQRYLADGRNAVINEEAARQAIELQFQRDTLTAKQANETALKALDATIGFGAANDPNKAGTLEQDLARIENDEQTKLAALQAQQELFLNNEKEYEKRLTKIKDDANAKRKSATDAANKLALASAQDGINSLLQVMEDGNREQSGLYKVMFAASKAFAIAESTISIVQGIANAAKLGWPANIAAMASVAASTANLISQIQSVKLAFADGGFVQGPGGPRSDQVHAMLSNGEFVMNARATAQYRGLLEQLNSGKEPRFRYADGGFVGAERVRTGVPMGGGVNLYQTNNITISRTGATGPGMSGEDEDRRLAELVDERVATGTRAIIADEQRAGGQLASLRKRK